MNTEKLSKGAVFKLYENERAIERLQFREAYPRELDGAVILGNETLRIKLTKNLDLLSANYKEVYYESSERVVRTVAPSDIKSFCHYKGNVDNEAASYVTLNLCNDHVTGTGYIGHKHYVIDRLEIRPFQDHVTSDNYICGHQSDSTITGARIGDRRSKRASNNKPSYYTKYLTWKDLYVELAIVFDNSMYKKYGTDKKRLFQRAKDLANLINAYYQPIRIKVALAGVEIWSESDRVVVSTSGDATLDQFLRYRKVNLIHDIPNDHAQLLTNATFHGGVVGKAMKGTMCSTEYSGAVVMDHDRFRSIAPIAATMAHEMGHNFGMEHDTDSCECPQQRCLMAASSSGAGNVYWSSCSLEYLSWSVSHGADYCLRNKPPSAKEPLCGNGFLEDGEECDCGLSDVCDNPCCNATTCRFASGAACANGACCDLSTCQFTALAAVCRGAENECDLPEFCNGKSEACPKDTYKQNGIPCGGEKGFCYNGTCGMHDDQCKVIWGSTGQAGSPICYGLNVKGSAEGHCGVDRSGSFVRCDNRDSMCGLLQCAQKTEKTTYGERSIVRVTSTVLHVNNQLVNCHTALIDLGLDRPNPGLVPNGAKCGDAKVCVKQTCVPIAKVLAESPCPSNCHDSGVCNNYGHCHCVSGYGGLDCSIPGLGGSIDSGPASTGVGRFNVGVGILVFLLVVLPLVTAIVTCLYKKGLIKSPRLKVIDLIFKPRVTKRRPVSSPRADIAQTCPRAFDSATVSRRAPPILAYSVDGPRRCPQSHTLIDSSSDPPPCSPTAGSTDPWKLTESGNQPSTSVHREDDRTEAPPRPAPLSDEVLERLYYTDVAAAPRRADEKDTESDQPAASLLCEVLTALEPEYGPVILPQRRAPPPPTIEEETVEGANNAEDGAEGQKTSLVKEKKRLFEAAAKGNAGSRKKRSAKESGADGAKVKATDKKTPLDISEPLNPVVSGEPVTQSSSLLIVPHLESQTLPRKKHSDTVLCSSTVRQLSQRNSTAVEEPSWRRGQPPPHAVQRSHSTVSTTRPSIAPPPPPPPPKTYASKVIRSAAANASSIISSSSTAPSARNENFAGDRSPITADHSGSPNDMRSGSSTENYYDVIASPIDDANEEIYADIDEIRTAFKGVKPAFTSNTDLGTGNGASPKYRTLYPSKAV